MGICGLPENCSQILGSCSRIRENCSKIPEICNIPEVCDVRKNCSQIVENCHFRQICNLTVNFFSSSGDQYATRVILLVSAVILFIFLLLKDGVKGLKSRAQWIPGDFLVLSALTIELLNLISTQGKPLELNTGDISLNVFWMIHTSRIMLCVVVAYLMPTMANPGAEDFWGKILALAMVVFLHVLSELYIVNPKFAGLYMKSLWPKQRGTSITLYYILGALMLLSFVLLLLLLGCANIAGRGIERILAKKIPVILKEQSEKDHHHHHRHNQHQQPSETVEGDHRCQECWQKVEDAVRRAWIVARAYSLEHIIARSALTASAATVVTTQITITVVAGVWNSPRMKMCNSEDWLMLAITMLQCVFILIGWTMILWRWATAVAYYGSWGSCLWMEDFWTRHLRELQEAKTTRRLRQAELLHAKIEALVTNESTIITSPRRLLYAVIWLQWLTVSFSKSCWLASQLLFRNKLTGRLLSSQLSKLKNKYSPDYERMLMGVQILGETSESLWLSNRHSIEKAERLISRGGHDAKDNCQVQLVDFVATKKTDHGLELSFLDPYKHQSGLKYLCKITPIKGTEQAQEEEFTDMGTKSWKMTAVSLLSIIHQLSQICAPTQKERPSTSQLLPHGKVLKDCLDAYSRAWEIIDFVDKADTEVDEMTSEAADQYFFILQAKVAAASNSSEPAHDENMAPHEEATKSKAQTPVCLNSLVSEIREKSRGCINRWSGDDSTEFKATDSVVAALAELKKECKSKTQTVLVNVLCPKSKEKKEDESKTQTPDNVDGRPLKRKEKGEDRSKSETAGSVNVVRLCRSRWNGRDSTDWTAAAWGSAVYKLCNSIQCDDGTDVNDLLKELENCLADIIKYCLEKIQHLLFLNSRKWTVNSDERKSAKALFTTGKARMIIKMLSEKMKEDQRSGSAVVP